MLVRAHQEGKTFVAEHLKGKHMWGWIEFTPEEERALEAADREMTRERGEELRIPQPEGGVPPSHDPRPSDAEAKVGLVLSLPERDIAFLEWLGLNHVSDAVHTLVNWYQRLPPAHRGELLELFDPHDATQAAQVWVGTPHSPRSPNTCRRQR